MALIPTRDLAFLQWGGQHAPVWVQSATSIGMTTQQATGISAAVSNAQAEYDAMQAAKEAYRSAGEVWRNAKSNARTALSDGVRSVRAYAAQQGDPTKVYTIAQIPPPASPSPSVPPNSPYDLHATLDTATGVLTVRWKATQPDGMSGVVYQVQRAVGGGSNPAWVTVGLTGQKFFEDAQIPGGSTLVQYRLQAQRGSFTSGYTNPLAVRFGTGASGETFILTETFGGKKMAA